VGSRVLVFNGDRRFRDDLVVKGDGEGRSASSRNVDGGQVSSVLVITSRDSGGIIAGSDDECSASERDWVTMFVSGLDDEFEALVIGGADVDTRQDFEVEGGVFDILTFEGDIDGDWTGILSGVIDSVSAVAIVGDFARDLFVWTTDLDDERIATIASWFAFVINSVDDELSGLVIDNCAVGDTITCGIRLIGIA